MTSNNGVRAACAVALYLVVAAALSNVGPDAAVGRLAGRLGPPGERPGITPAAISIFLGRLGPDGRGVYRRALYLDFALPALFLGAGWLIVRWARERAPHLRLGPSLILKLVILVAAVEVVENLLLLSALQNYPGRPPLGESVGQIVGLKLALFGLSVVSLVGLTIVAVMDGWRAGRRDGSAGRVV